MNIEKIKETLRNQPNYRYKQVFEAIYQKAISSWSEASSLPKNLRETLEKECSLDIPAEIYKSADKKTIKAVFKLADGFEVEAVLMRFGGRNTICVSSQAGCPLGCTFCATGEMGFNRNLEYFEIVNQVLFFARYLKNNFSEEEKITNLVFMGMGEPFLNYENVMKAIKFMHDPEIFNLGARRFSISTIGIIEGIKKLAKEKMEINLAVSVHAPNDKLRLSIIPSAKKYPLIKIMAATDDYIEKTGRKVMIEYLMLKDVNDTAVEAKQLAELTRHKLMVVNLISYNPGLGFESSTKEAISRFKRVLNESGVETTERFRLGRDIKGGCGQLAGKQI